MPPVKAVTFALPLVSALMLAGSAANATVAYKKHASATHATQSTLSDNNAPIASLSAREFFERISGNSR